MAWNKKNYSNVDKSTGEIKKRSGAQKRTSKNGTNYISGWNYSNRRGLISLAAFPVSKGKSEGTSQSGKRWLRFLAVVEYKDSGNVRKESAFFYPDTNRLVIKSLGMVASLNKNYFGTYKRRK